MFKMSVSAVLAFLIASATFGQSKPYKIKFSGKDKKVSILVFQNAIQVTGYDGDEVIIEAESNNNAKGFPKEAEGLRMVSGSGIADNTGLGASAEQVGNVLNITVPKNKYFGNISIKVPREVAVSIRENENIWNNQWKISGLSGEIELKANHTAITLDDISGPLVCNAGWGKVKINYTSISQSAPHSITTLSPVDVTLPTDAKATLGLKSTFGDVFTDWELTPLKTENKKEKGEKPVVAATKNDDDENNKALAVAGIVVRDNDEVVLVEKDGVGNQKKVTTTVKRYATRTNGEPGPHFNVRTFISSNSNGDSWDTDGNHNFTNGKDPNTVEGDINGGGVKLFITAMNGNIYLRKKK